jgi:hypothetical protein
VRDHNETFSRPRVVRPARTIRAGPFRPVRRGGGGCVRFGIEAVRGPFPLFVSARTARFERPAARGLLHHAKNLRSQATCRRWRFCSRPLWPYYPRNASSSDSRTQKPHRSARETPCRSSPPGNIFQTVRAGERNLACIQAPAAADGPLVVAPKRLTQNKPQKKWVI